MAITSPISMRFSPPLLFFLTVFMTVVPFGYADSISSDNRPIHVLNRMAFGPRPDDLERVKSMGVDGYIQEQLSPSTLAVPDSLRTKLNSLETLGRSAPELFLEYGPPSYAANKGDRQAAQKARQRARVIVDQAIDARILRAIESPRQLEEVMINFWFNHFNVFAQKGLDHLWIGSYEEEAIRPYALGRFRDLLDATAKHPAMLFYLDNWQNTAPGSQGSRGPFKGLNENYARELMELHTLGVDGGYTQQDVITLAKIFTGWGFRRPGQGQPITRSTGKISFPVSPNDANGFFFDSNRHVFSAKSFLGHPIKGSGMSEGEEALDILAAHPSTAKFISYKLAQYFVADDPPKSLTDRLAKRFLDSRGDIRAVLDSLFHSPEFWDEQYASGKFKTPYEYVISSVRASGIPVSNTRPLRGTIGLLGMPIYGRLTPDGYKNTQAAWLNPNAMTERLAFATALASGRLPLNQQPAKSLEQMDGSKTAEPPVQSNRIKALQASDLLSAVGNSLSAHTRSSIESSPAPIRAAMILGSPEFMRR